jgi:hypothetical protein
MRLFDEDDLHRRGSSRYPTEWMRYPLWRLDLISPHLSTPKKHELTTMMQLEADVHHPVLNLTQ